MKRFQGFKFELRPNGEQQRQMRRFAGACRVVFNEALALQKTSHEEAPVHPQQQALKDLERVYTHFFAKRAGAING